MDPEHGLNWFKKHADTIVILGVFAAAFINLNDKISSIERDVAIMKTVLIMKNIMPSDVAKCEKKEDKNG